VSGSDADFDARLAKLCESSVPEEWTIFQRLAFASAVVGSVPKDSEMKSGYGEQQKVEYRFRSIEAINARTQPVFAALGIVVGSRTIEREVRQVERGANKNLWSHVSTHIEFAFIGPKGDRHLVDLWSEGLDNQDKGSTKAYTQARKYATVVALNLAEGDEDTVQAPEASTQPTSGQRSRRAREAPSSDESASTEALVTDEMWAEIKAIRDQLSDEGREHLREWARVAPFDTAAPTTMPRPVGRRMKAYAAGLLKAHPREAAASRARDAEEERPGPEAAAEHGLAPDEVGVEGMWQCSAEAAHVVKGKRGDRCPVCRAGGSWLVQEAPF
jgi:hypothetical protein